MYKQNAALQRRPEAKRKGVRWKRLLGAPVTCTFVGLASCSEPRDDERAIEPHAHSFGLWEVGDLRDDRERVTQHLLVSHPQDVEPQASKIGVTARVAVGVLVRRAVDLNKEVPSRDGEVDDHSRDNELTSNSSLAGVTQSKMKMMLRTRSVASQGLRPLLQFRMI